MKKTTKTATAKMTTSARTTASGAAHRGQMALIGVALGRVTDGLMKHAAEAGAELETRENFHLVGDATRIRQALEDLADMLHGTGEYAVDAPAKVRS